MFFQNFSNIEVVARELHLSKVVGVWSCFSLKFGQKNFQFWNKTFDFKNKKL
jgi:hypothetical protein